MGVAKALGVIDRREEGGGGDGAHARDQAQAPHARVLRARRSMVSSEYVSCGLGGHDGEQRRDHREQAAGKGRALDGDS